MSEMYGYFGVHYTSVDLFSDYELLWFEVIINFWLFFIICSECISSVESELNLNKSVDSWHTGSSTTATTTTLDGDDSLSQQYILSVSHKDSLRHQLSHIRHMRDEYETHLRLRDALTKMMKISKSRDCENEWKENSRVLVTFERQLENMIG